jgi:DNA modification methylase
VSEATYLVGDVFDRMAAMPDGSVDLVLTSPPFLALRSYLPADHPDKAKEIGSEPTPAEFLDTLLRLTAEWGRLLAPHGSIAVELGDTYASSGGITDNSDDSLGGNDFAPRGRRGNGPGWPLDKSMCGIPHLYHHATTFRTRHMPAGDSSPVRRLRP